MSNFQSYKVGWRTIREGQGAMGNATTIMVLRTPSACCPSSDPLMRRSTIFPPAPPGKCHWREDPLPWTLVIWDRWLLMVMMVQMVQRK